MADIKLYVADMSSSRDVSTYFLHEQKENYPKNNLICQRNTL